jgi:hypothetical protein
LSIPDDVEYLISHLAGPLAPDERRAFRAAAETAIAGVVCPGPGAIYRTVSQLQRAYFSPPAVAHEAWNGGNPRVSKLRSAPPLAHGRDRRYTRRQLRAAG